MNWMELVSVTNHCCQKLITSGTLKRNRSSSQLTWMWNQSTKIKSTILNFRKHKGKWSVIHTLITLNLNIHWAKIKMNNKLEIVNLWVVVLPQMHLKDSIYECKKLIMNVFKNKLYSLIKKARGCIHLHGGKFSHFLSN